MSQVQYRLIFEYPHLGPNMVSESPPSLHHLEEPSEVPGLSRDPEAYSYDTASDTDTDDEDDLQDLQDVSWYPHAVHFLAQVPHDDADWSRYLTSNGDVRSLCHRLKVPFLYPGLPVHLDWPLFFDECAWHLAQASSNPPLGSLFSLIFVAACHVALVDGCPREIVYKGLKACVRHCGVAEEELTQPMLDRVREGIITGIGILREYTKVVGCRANEIPLHAHNCLQMFQCCNPACLLFIKGQISSTYQPTTPLQSECLEIPSLVYDLLGGRRSKWDYQAICQILCPEVASEVCGYDSVDMTDVMELDERDDGIVGMGVWVPG